MLNINLPSNYLVFFLFCSSRVPTLSEMQCIFLDYEINCRSFEAWHAQQRHALLQLTLQAQHAKIFAVAKPAAKTPLQHLETKVDTTILGVSEDHTQLHVEHTLHIDSSC